MITGAGSSDFVNKSTNEQFSLSYNLYAFFFPGNVTFWNSSLNLMHGLPFTSTNLKTHPKAGCFWHVTKWVPIPNVFIEWPCEFNECRISSLISLLATIVKLVNQSMLNLK